MAIMPLGLESAAPAEADRSDRRRSPREHRGAMRWGRSPPTSAPASSNPNATPGIRS